MFVSREKEDEFVIVRSFLYVGAYACVRLDEAIHQLHSCFFEGYCILSLMKKKQKKKCQRGECHSWPVEEKIVDCNNLLSCRCEE